jgi:catechol 2,3-dioxygenase-like lactoylglutathione lyase family enzyme
MEPRLSLVTLGVTDLARARRFYEEGLGWRASALSNAEVVFFQAGGTIIGCFGREALAADAGLPAAPTGGFSGIALAHNVPSRAEVDAVLAEAARAGAAITQPARDTEWGGYSGYFTDPEGHLWEVAWNPGFPLTKDGRTLLPR